MLKKKIFTKKLALYLRSNGCKILSTEPNRQKPEFDVYLFEDNDRLRELMNSYGI